MPNRSCILALALALGAVSADSVNSQEKPKIDDNSAEVVLRGCANGRALVPMDIEGSVPTPRTLTGRAVRLNGPKAILKDIGKQKGRLIEVTGLVRRADLQPTGPSTTIGGMRVTVGGSSPMSMDPTRADPTRQAMMNVVHVDVSGYRVLDTTCPAR